MDVFAYIPKNLETIWRKRFPNTGDYKNWVIKKFLEDINSSMNEQEIDKEIQLRELQIKEKEIEIVKLENEKRKKQEMKEQEQEEAVLNKKQQKQMQKDREINQKERKKERLCDWIVNTSEHTIGRSDAFKLVNQFMKLNKPDDHLIEFLETKEIYFKDKLLVKGMITK